MGRDLVAVFARRRRAVGGVLVAVALAAAWLHVGGLPVMLPLPAASIQPDGGLGYVAPVPRLRLFFIERDTEAAQASTARLTEDGRQIGIPHALHDEIRQRGGGRFSHWHRTLHFSTPDGSDPRSNGRRYALEGTRHLQRSPFQIALALGLAGVLLMVPGSGLARLWTAVQGATRALRRLAPPRIDPAAGSRAVAYGGRAAWAAARAGGAAAGRAWTALLVGAGALARRSRRAIRVALIVLAVPAAMLLAVGAAELYVALALPFVRPQIALRSVPEVGVTYLPGSRVRWTNLVDFWADEPVNALGFVEAEPQARRHPDECRIAVVGDSFVEAIQVAIADKLPRRLAALLRDGMPGRAFATQGFGYSGTGQAAQLAYYERFVRGWEPDVVVLVVVSNDLANNSPVIESVRNGWHPEHPGFASFIEGADGIRPLPPDPAWPAHALRAQFPSPRALHLWLDAQLPSYRWALTHAAMRFPSTVAGWVRGPSAAEIFLPRLAALRREGRHADGFEGWAYPQDLDLDNMFFAETMPPVFEQAVRLSRHAMLEWRRRADRDGVRLVALTAHEMVRPMPEVQFGRRTDPGRYRARVVAAAQAAGIPTIDQHEFVRARGANLADLIFRRDSHWSPLGHQLAAEAVYEHVRRDPALCGRRGGAP